MKVDEQIGWIYKPIRRNSIEERDKYEAERQSKLEEIENKTKELLEKFPEMVDEIEKAILYQRTR